MSSWLQGFFFGVFVGADVGMGPIAAAVWFLVNGQRRAR